MTPKEEKELLETLGLASRFHRFGVLVIAEVIAMAKSEKKTEKAFALKILQRALSMEKHEQFESFLRKLM